MTINEYSDVDDKRMRLQEASLVYCTNRTKRVNVKTTLKRKPLSSTKRVREGSPTGGVVVVIIIVLQFLTRNAIINN